MCGRGTMASTVLIVEDHEDFRLTLAEILRLDGWRAFVAAGVDEALEVAQRGGIDIVLCDVIMPRKRGPGFNGRSRWTLRWSASRSSS